MEDLNSQKLKELTDRYYNFLIDILSSDSDLKGINIEFSKLNKNHELKDIKNGDND